MGFFQDDSSVAGSQRSVCSSCPSKEPTGTRFSSSRKPAHVHWSPGQHNMVISVVSCLVVKKKKKYLSLLHNGLIPNWGKKPKLKNPCFPYVMQVPEKCSTAAYDTPTKSPCKHIYTITSLFLRPLTKSNNSTTATTSVNVS